MNEPTAFLRLWDTAKQVAIGTYLGHLAVNAIEDTIEAHEERQKQNFIEALQIALAEPDTHDNVALCLSRDEAAELLKLFQDLKAACEEVAAHSNVQAAHAESQLKQIENLMESRKRMEEHFNELASLLATPPALPPQKAPSPQMLRFFRAEIDDIYQNAHTDSYTMDEAYKYLVLMPDEVLAETACTDERGTEVDEPQDFDRKSFEYEFNRLWAEFGGEYQLVNFIDIPQVTPQPTERPGVLEPIAGQRTSGPTEQDVAADPVTHIDALCRWDFPTYLRNYRLINRKMNELEKRVRHLTGLQNVERKLNGGKEVTEIPAEWTTALKKWRRFLDTLGTRQPIRD